MDFLAYTFAGVLVAGFGAMIFWWAFLFDRLTGGRKKRRCPKCWYDMAAVPSLTCPECGKTAKTERRLFTARKRWWIALGSILIIVTGLGLTTWPVVRGRGWTKLLSPPWVMWIDSLGSEFRDAEEYLNLSTPRWRRGIAMPVTQAAPDLASHNISRVRIAVRNVLEWTGPAAAPSQQNAINVLALYQREHGELFDEWTLMLSHANAAVQWSCLTQLEYFQFEYDPVDVFGSGAPAPSNAAAAKYAALKAASKKVLETPEAVRIRTARDASRRQTSGWGTNTPPVDPRPDPATAKASDVAGQIVTDFLRRDAIYLRKALEHADGPAIAADVLAGVTSKLDSVEHAYALNDLCRELVRLANDPNTGAKWTGVKDAAIARHVDLLVSLRTWSAPAFSAFEMSDPTANALIAARLREWIKSPADSTQIMLRLAIANPVWPPDLLHEFSTYAIKHLNNPATQETAVTLLMVVPVDSAALRESLNVKSELARYRLIEAIRSRINHLRDEHAPMLREELLRIGSDTTQPRALRAIALLALTDCDQERGKLTNPPAPGAKR